MSYTAKTWVTGEVIQAVDLNHAEQGIAEADAKATAISANGAIGTANLANASVTNAKLDQGAVDTSNIANGAVGTTEIQDGAVTSAKLDESATDIIADTFSASVAYSTGDYCIYSGALYRFTADKAVGAWDGTKVVSVALADDVSELKSALDEAIEDFAVPTQEAVDNWLTAHPEATTTVQDGSLTEAKFSNALKLKTIKDYVTPEMFGAVGDGVTDDTVAVQSAINNGDFVLMPNSYSISNTIVIASKKIVNCSGAITYAGNGVAVKISTQNGGDYFFNEINALNGTCVLMEANTNGTYLNNTHRFNRLNGKVGCEIYATGGAGNQWNTMYLGWVKCSEKCIYIHSDNGAFCGEWRIFGGLLYYNQPAPGIEVIGLDVSDCTGLRIFGTGFEGLGTGIVIKDSAETSIYGSRFESANQYNGKTFVLKGQVSAMLASGDIYNLSEIDMSALTSVGVGNIIFDGLILTAGGVPAGSKYIITNDLKGYVSERNAKQTAFFTFDQYYSGNTLGGIDNFAPNVITVKKNLVLGDQYRVGGVERVILLIQGSGITVSDTDGTVMLTTTDSYSGYDVVAQGSPFLGSGKGKNGLRFTKFVSA